MAARATEDITAIMGYAKKYEKKIILNILQGMDLFTDVATIYNLSSTLVLPKYAANDGFRPEDTSIFTQEGSAGGFSTRSITPRVGMKILEIVPAEYRNTYFSDQMKPNAKDIPFADAFWMAQNEKLASEVNAGFYFGQNTEEIPVYNSVNTYAVGARVKFATDKNFYIATAAVAANETPATHPAKWANANKSSVAKGFGTIISEDFAQIPAANKVVTGVLTATNAHDQVIAVVKAVPQHLRDLGGVVYCSADTKELYRQATLAKYPGNEGINDRRANVSNFIYGTDDKWSLKPVSWMAGSQRLIAVVNPSLFRNLIVATNLLSDFNSIGEEVKNLHGYSTVMKMSLAAQIADLSMLWVNDQK